MVGLELSGDLIVISQRGPHDVFGMIGTPGTGGVAGRRWLVNAPQLKIKRMKKKVLT